MKKAILASLFGSLLVTLALPAAARDDRLTFSIKEALSTPAAQDKIDKDIALQFGDRPAGASAKVLGEWKTNKKTNAFNKTDKEACEWAFLSAVLELQERAQKEGGTAVVNIKSNYKNDERSSEEEYVCGAGALMAGVALKGTVVKKSK